MLEPLLYIYWHTYHKALVWLYNSLPLTNNGLLNMALKIGKAQSKAKRLLKSDWNKETQYKN